MSSKRVSIALPPSRAVQAETADRWVEQGRAQEPAPPPPMTPPKTAPVAVKTARLTIDLPLDLHTRFKVACANRRTKMVAEVTQFIEEWTQKNS
jgi:hypothetical protein